MLPCHLNFEKLWSDHVDNRYERFASHSFFWNNPMETDYVRRMMLSGNFNGMLQARLEYLWENRFLDDAKELAADVFFTNPYPHWFDETWIFRYSNDWLYERFHLNKNHRNILKELIYTKVLPFPTDVTNIIFEMYYVPLQ